MRLTRTFCFGTTWRFYLRATNIQRDKVKDPEMASTRSAVLQLYRDLLRYGRKLEFTDKEYYFLRIRHEFQSKKHFQGDIVREIQVIL